MPPTPALIARGQRSTPLQEPNPVKSILRVASTPITPSFPATLLGTRKRDDDDDEAVSSPPKRKKSVHFDMSLNVTTEIGNRSLEGTQKEVRAALEAHGRGDHASYLELREIFSNDTQRYMPPIAGEEEEMLKPQELVVYLVALTAFAPRLNKSCFDLVKALLTCSYLGRDDNFYRAYCQCMAALVSAHGPYLVPVLESMVDKFTWTRPTSWSVPDFAEVSHETMQERLHLGLKYMLQLFPAARSALCHVVTRKFPYTEHSKRAYIAYIDNLLRLAEYAPTIAPEIMELIINRLVNLDVQMDLDLDDADDDLTSKVLVQLQSPQSDQDDDVDSDTESLMSDDPDFDAEATRIEKATSLVMKLDATLDRLFGLYTPIFAKPMSGKTRAIYESLLSEFTNHILPTQRCRCSQFLVFHFSQATPEFIDMFVGTLLNLAFETNKPAATRLAAAAYLGSYVSRAAHVQPQTVQSIATVLCHRIESYRQKYAANCRGPELHRYAQFYSWFQAAIYIFCFRWRDLVDDLPDSVDPDDPATFVGHHLQWLTGFREAISNAIYSPFNPLKVCTPPIVQEFTKLAHLLHFAYFYPKVEGNKNINLAQFVTGTYASGGALRDAGRDPHDEAFLQLESQFPFDPYQLPNSKRWLEGDYVAWKSIPGVDKDDTDAERRNDDSAAEDEAAASDDETDDSDDD